MTTELHSLHDHAEDTTAAEVRESAYRRGFEQGLLMAIRLLEAGGSLGDLHGYAVEVREWRERLGKYHQPRDRVERSPVPSELPEE